MSATTPAFYDRMAGDGTLIALVSTYGGNPAVFTTDPAPGDATLPYVVTAGEVSQVPFDTKTTQGRTIMRDVRCYAAADGSAVTVEAIAERVRALFHRQWISIAGFNWIWAECSGPIVADERDAYGRIVTGSQRDVTFDETTAEIDVSSKDSRAMRVLPGRYGATLSLDSLYVPTDTAYQALLAAMRNGTFVEVVAIEEGVVLESADAIVTKLSKSGPDQGEATVSISLRIDGEWVSGS